MQDLNVGAGLGSGAAPFTVLMAVYAGDNLEHFKAAVFSNTVEQTRMPAQIVIVRDGPVPADIQEFLDRLPAIIERECERAHERGGKEPDHFRTTIVNLPENKGLANALNQGLMACQNEIVARADSDDISLPHRFEQLIPVLEGGGGETDGADSDIGDGGVDSASGGARDSARAPRRIDVVSSAVQEFSADPETGERIGGRIRSLPEGGKALDDYARLQSPINHPAAAFRRSAITAVGGYPTDVGRFEDYRLWEKLMVTGYRFANLTQVLVAYRVDEGAYSRRGGLEMFREEVHLQKLFRRDGFVTLPQFVRNVCVRAMYRLAPTRLRTLTYRLLLKVRGKN